MSQHRITLSNTAPTFTSKPQVLLWCDQLWELLETTNPQVELPSGLLLIPSKLGYLLTVKQQTHQDNTEDTTDSINVNMVYMMNTKSELDDELTRWDKYWTLDLAGICEFTSTKDAETEASNRQAVQFFNDTIECRNDGYYARLPFKDQHTPLPDNKQIAFRRLQRILAMLNTKPELLEQYNSTFQQQLEKEIIEEVPGNITTEGPIIHYIPHQPVLTPHKETTKLRIVFDASASTPNILEHKIRESRNIFQNMKMNLREFATNGSSLSEILPDEACAKSTIQKVLGVEWH
ncbi:unnamed protein product [Nippostrongylus brasiliensis]|uniref:DUF1758 domain-containing protein n=1 Tax=Nippostrongylus brasiliensis TaxID=27835 RepID=A0A0N4YJU1_NIPBR|nr:unnamed protein product [Nippostrongylus brasiliensis]